MARSQSTHRATIGDFWRTSQWDGKIIPGWWGGGGARQTPCHCQSVLPSRTKLHGVRSCWEGRYSPSISSLPYMYSVGKMNATINMTFPFIYKLNLRNNKVQHYKCTFSRLVTQQPWRNNPKQRLLIVVNVYCIKKKHQVEQRPFSPTT